MLFDLTYTPHQRAVLNSTAKQIVIAGSRATGKTLVGLEWAFSQLDKPKTAVLYLSPSRPQSKFHFQRLSHLSSVTHRKTDLLCSADNGSFLQFSYKIPEEVMWSAIVVDGFAHFTIDPMAYHGLLPRWLCMDIIDDQAKRYSQFRKLFNDPMSESHSWSAFMLPGGLPRGIERNIGTSVFNQQYLNIWPAITE